MYHDYILKELSEGRIAEARRQAAADGASRAAKKNEKQEAKAGGLRRLVGSVQATVRKMAGAHS